MDVSTPSSQALDVAHRVSDSRDQPRPTGQSPAHYPDAPQRLLLGLSTRIPLQWRDASTPRLQFQLLQGPEGLALDAKSGSLSWRPTTQQIGTHSVSVAIEHAGQQWVQSLSFDVQGGERLALRERQGVYWVEAASGDYQGLGVKWLDQTLARDSWQLEALPEQALPAIAADLERISPSFRLLRSSPSVEAAQLQVAQQHLPAQVQAFEVRLYELRQSPVHNAEWHWLDSGALVRSDGQGGLLFDDVPVDIPLMLVREPIQVEPMLAQAEVRSGAPLNCRAQTFEQQTLTGQWQCQSGDLNIQVVDLHKAEWDFDFDAHTVAQWALDAQAAMAPLSLSLGAQIKLVVAPMKDDLLGYWSGGASVYVTPKAVTQKLIRATVVHELLHLAQGRRWPVWHSGDSWLVEGSARWFEDLVYDQDNVYAEEEGRFYNYIQPGLVSSGYGAAAQRPYQRFSFFKLLHNRCGGAQDLFQSLDTLSYEGVSQWLPQLSCDLGFDLGDSAEIDYAEALLYLFHALGVRNSLKVLDGNEPEWPAQWFSNNALPLGTQAPWQAQLNPGSGVQLLLSDISSATPAQLHINISVTGGEAPLLAALSGDTLRPWLADESLFTLQGREQASAWVSQQHTWVLPFSGSLPPLTLLLINPATGEHNLPHASVSMSVVYPEKIPVPEVTLPDKVSLGQSLVATLRAAQSPIATRFACQLNQQAVKTSSGYHTQAQETRISWLVLIPEKLHVRCWSEAEDGRKSELFEQEVAIGLANDGPTGGETPEPPGRVSVQHIDGEPAGLDLQWAPEPQASSYQIQLWDAKGQLWRYRWSAEALNCSAERCHLRLYAGFAPGPGQLSLLPLNHFELPIGAAQPQALMINTADGEAVVPDVDAELVEALSPREQTLSGRVLFRWRAHPGAARYRLYIGDAAGALAVREILAEQAGCVQGEAECAWEADVLLSDGEAHWRVQAGRFDHWAERSNARVHFEVSNQPVVSHKTVGQAPIGAVQGSEIEFVWQAVSLASRYRLTLTEFQTQERWQWVVSAQQAACDAGQGVCVWRLASALPEGVYEWRVLLGDAAGWAARYSEPLAITVSFDEQSNNTAMSLLGVAEGMDALSSEYLLRPRLRWHAANGATRYRLEIQQGHGMHSWELQSDALGCADGQSACRWLLPTALEAGEARWRLRAGDARRWSQQASDWQTMQIDDRLEPPLVIAPEGYHWSAKARLRWFATAMATRYRLRLGQAGQPAQVWELSAESLGCAARGRICQWSVSVPFGRSEWQLQAGDAEGWWQPESRVMALQRIE